MCAGQAKAPKNEDTGINVAQQKLQHRANEAVQFTPVAKSVISIFF